MTIQDNIDTIRGAVNGKQVREAIAQLGEAVRDIPDVSGSLDDLNAAVTNANSIIATIEAKANNAADKAATTAATNAVKNVTGQLQAAQADANQIIVDLDNANKQVNKQLIDAQSIIISNENTLAQVREQSENIQSIAAYNQDQIDKGTVATQDQINSISSDLEEKANEVDLIVEKNRIDNLINISSGEVDNAEVSDARISVNGKTYNNLGNAIRGQFKEITEIADKDITNDLVWIDNTWIRQNFIETSNGYKVAKIKVSEGEVFTISGTIYNFQSLFVVRNEEDLDRNNGGGLGLLCYPEVRGAVANVPYKLIENYQFTIPTGGKYLYVNKYCGTSPNMGKESAFKLLKNNEEIKIKGLSDIEVNIKEIENENLIINSNISDLDFDKENWKDRIIENQLKNDFAWGTPNKLYVTFCFDDSLSDISDIEDLFEQKGVPCCFATVPNRLNNITNSGETVKQVLQRAVENGGEVLSHWATPLLPTSKDEDYYNVYIGAKKTLVENGFEVNGIITSGGGNFNLQDFDKDILLARPYYRYADLTDFNNTGVEQYLNRRRFLTTDNTINKGCIDTFISQGQLNNGGDKTYYGKYRWLPFASHGAHDNITISILSELIDYIQSKGNNVIEIVNYKYLFDNFSSSKLEKRILSLENA